MRPSDSELVTEALRGRRDAFDRLLHRHRSAVVAYLGACGCRRSDVEDLCQETYIRGYLMLAQYDANQTFVGWLLGIAHNVFRHHRRRARVMLDAIQKIGLRTIQKLEPEPASTEDFTEQRAAAVRSAVESLGSPLRAVLFLRYHQQMSVEEIARVEGVSVGSVKMRLLRARRLLKQRLSRWEVTASRGEES
jgi:RNA polymerase sigma-70 factor, ECF subfamily